MSARDDILDRIRQAVAGSPAAVEVPRDYRAAGTLPSSERLDLLAERLVDYRARVRRCGADELASEIATALREQGASRVVVPRELGVELPSDVDVSVDDGQLSAAELDAWDGVVTLAAVAIAETGTVVLDGSEGQGRRAITLVPDYHLCIVAESNVVETVPEAIARLRPERPMTWVSGPSATSDIELDRVEGVHGPRTLEVVLVTD